MKSFPVDIGIPCLKLAVSHLKMDGWNTIVEIRPSFRGENVSFREGKTQSQQKPMEHGESA